MVLKRWQKEEQLRLRGVAMLDDGLPPTEVARQLGVSRVTVWRWEWRGRGKDARIKPSGRKCALTLAQRRQLEGLLEQGAVRYGFATEVWTGRRIARLIEEQLGVRYHFKAIPYLLCTLGWSWQEPGRRAVERKEAAIRRWIRRQLQPSARKSVSQLGFHESASKMV